MRSRFLAAALVLAVIAPTASVAAPTARTERASHNPAVAYRTALMRGDLTLGEFIRLRHNLMVAPRAMGGSGLDSVVGALDERQRVMFHGNTELALLAVDPDGDGKDGVLSASYGSGCFVCPEFLIEPSPGTLKLREGDDGDVVWSVPTSNLWYATTADVDGDGTEEIILIEEEAIGAGSWFIAGAIGYVFQSRIRVLEAATGRQRWQATREGAAAIAGGGFFAGAIVYGVHNVMQEVVTTEDADGRAGADVFQGRIDAGLVEGFAVLALGLVAGIRVTGETLAGGDGGSIGAVTTTGSWLIGCALLCAGFYGWPGVSPVGDVNGDDRSDVIAADSHGSVLHLSARSVDGGARYWEQPIVLPFNGFFFPIQLDGEGPADVVVFDSWSGDAQARSGADGSLMWERGSEIYWSFPVGDVDGDGGEDLALEWGTYDEETNEYSPALLVLSGSTGEEIYERVVTSTVSYPSVGESLWPMSLSDLDGDGVLDVLFAHHFYEEVCYDEFECWWETSARSTLAFTVKSGAVLWESTPDPSERTYPLGFDADDDGGDDVGAFAVTPGALSIAVRSGADLAPVWEASTPVEGNEIYVDYIFGADVDAADGEEAVVTLWDEYWDEETGEYVFYGYNSRVVGASGELWRIA